MLNTAELRVLREQTHGLEHRHGDRWIRMDRTIPVVSDRYPKSDPVSWKCDSCGLTVLNEWRAPTEAR